MKGNLRAAILASLALGLVSCAWSAREAEPDEVRARVAEDRAALRAAPPPPDELTLSEAVGRAVHQNLELRAALLEESLAHAEFREGRLDLLPRVVATNEYYGRNNQLASVSESVLTGNQSLEPSTSSDRYGWRSAATAAWNILDFGVGYLRSREAANEALLARERRNKALQDLVLDVSVAFWRVASAEHLLRQIEPVRVRLREAVAQSQTLTEAQLLDPIRANTFQRDVLDQLRALRSLERDAGAARLELSRAINAPGARFRVRGVDPVRARTPQLKVPVEQLEFDALRLRPELRGADYERRISRLEVRRALLEALPGLELRVGYNRESNDFLVDDNWWSYSGALSKNLVELVTAPKRIALAEDRGDLVDARRLALSTAVMAQVHLAYQDFRSAEAQVAISERRRDLESRASAITAVRADAGTASGLDAARAEGRQLVAELQHASAYARVRESFARLQNAVGETPAPRYEHLGDLAELSRWAEVTLTSWERRAAFGRGSARLAYRDLAPFRWHYSAPSPAVSSAPPR
jgi:outer membrane protein TolC